jgi:ethanolamine utilization protein EutQ (cupin superfamily)
MAEQDQNTSETTPPAKPSYTPEQQKHIDEMITARLTREKTASTKEMETLTAKVTELTSQLEAATKPETKGKEKDAETEQVKQLIAQEKANTKQAQDLVKRLQDDLTKTKDENSKILKSQAIRDAATKAAKFHNLAEVMLLTEGRIEFDTDLSRYVVRENGVVVKNSSMDPMELTEYYTQFAQQRPYMVNGDVVSGAGSHENGGGGNLGTVKSKADFKSAKERSDYITKFGLEAFENLPLR